ncbi:MAG: hypothetical protein RL749_568 [Verrucomicrobiota bacterium]|jgi:hypothetical protein
MKSALPVLGLTFLAASANAAEPAKLAYNRIGLEISESHQTVNSESSVNTVSLSVLLGESNFLATASSDEYFAIFGLGYLFRDVAFSTDVVISLSSAARYGTTRDTLYGIQLRRALPEIHDSLEALVSYAISHGTDGGSSEDTFRAELAYNFDARYQLAVGMVETDAHVAGGQSYLTVTARYNF